MTSPSNAEPDAFAERLRVQLQARHPGATVERDSSSYALRLRAPGVDLRLPIGPLQHACASRPAEAPRLIAAFVGSTEAQTVPRAPAPPPTSSLVWCVRTREYLAAHTRDADLLVRPLVGSLVAFVAEALPGTTMRGVPREEWAELGEEATARAADAATAERFAATLQRIRTEQRLAQSGWKFTRDSLFQGSLLTLPAVLAALVERAGGEVLLATPDRSQLFAIAAASPQAPSFERLVRRSWREALNACSPEVLRSDGVSLGAVAPVRRPREREPSLLRRLLG